MDKILTKEDILLAYERLEERFHTDGVDYATYDTPVNFKESLTKPIHRWYGYKEGFSPSFVKKFIDTYAAGQKNTVVFDPFGGVGTTALVAMQMGLRAYSMDVNPLGVFVAETKTKKYTASELSFLKRTCDELLETDDVEVAVSIQNETIRKYFDRKTWTSLVKILSFIQSIKRPGVHDLFLLGVLSLVSELSTHQKNGNGVKKKRILPPERNFHSLKLLLVEKIKVFVEDIKNSSLTGECSIKQASNIEPYSLPNKASVVLTSPPYANCFDYSKVYLTELWIGSFFKKKEDQASFREKSISSHIHYSWKKRNSAFGSDLVNNSIVPILNKEKLWSDRIPKMLSGYFSDMGRCLSNLSKNVKKGAVVGIVVGNSVYGGIPIATDLILAEMSERYGFKCCGIHVYRKVIASSQQMVLLTEKEKYFVRESMVVLKWH